ncbi:MAG: restriction endonuclease [Caldilinea sp. CFX5]|nr:restriction endonuclease [Caldilinea sp. CFX5]
MRKALRVIAWLLFWPVMLPVWLSYKYPTWLRWLFWIVAVLVLASTASVQKIDNGATVGGLLLVNLLAIGLYLLIKIGAFIAGNLRKEPVLPAAPLTIAAMPASPVPLTTHQTKQPSLQRSTQADLSSLDALEGIAFEHFVADLLASRGYKTEVTQASNDYGIDVIAFKDNIRFGVQVKRYTGSVSRTAISDAVAGARHWQCHASMVVTNSYFTSSAKQLADSTGCILIDRAVLAQWLAEKNLTSIPA